MFAVEVIALLLGFGGMVVASQRVVGAASDLAVGAQISPFIIGFTLLAIGTDLPEIANSIVSSLADHGDVNVGDSVGSAATQMTLVLGILGIGFGPLTLPNGNIARTGVFTVAALAVLALCISDGRFGRGRCAVSVGPVGSRFCPDLIGEQPSTTNSHCHKRRPPKGR